LLAPPRLLAPTSLASALGVLYVVEGSNLGGRVIGRHVSVALDVGVGAGGSFFCGLSAEQARRRWQVLVDTLHDTIDPTGAAQQPVIDAALATFAALGAWMRTVDTVDG
jgi:heme oxygenase